jgi:hypothetical protein
MGIAHTVKDDLSADWSLTDDLDDAKIEFRSFAPSDPALRFKSKNISIEVKRLTAPRLKHSLARAKVNHILTCDVWFKPQFWDESKFEGFEDNMESLVAEIVRIIKADQTSLTGVQFAYVSGETCLNEPENHVLRTQVQVTCITEE